MRDIIRVGIAEYKICKVPEEISTLGLGSCVGVVIYNKETGICGLAHIMLPDSKKMASSDNPYKFADTCLKEMIEQLQKQAGKNATFFAKVAGGAKMFSHSSNQEFLNIGALNYVAVCCVLAGYHIPIVSEDVGGNFSRTIIYNSENQELLIKAVKEKGVEKYVI